MGRGLAGWIEEAAAWQEGAQAAWLAQAALGAGVGELAQEWMVARNLALKGSRRPRADLVLRLSRRLQALAEWEELLLGRLEEELSGR